MIRKLRSRWCFAYTAIGVTLFMAGTVYAVVDCERCCHEARVWGWVDYDYDTEMEVTRCRRHTPHASAKNYYVNPDNCPFPNPECYSPGLKMGEMRMTKKQRCDQCPFVCRDVGLFFDQESTGAALGGCEDVTPLFAVLSCIKAPGCDGT